MYPGNYASQHPDRAAFVMASTGESVSYREFEARTNQLAHLLRASGLNNHDHYSIFMENNNRYMECCAAGERTGLYYTCVNHYLKGDELAYILDNSESQVLIVSAAKLAPALEALEEARGVKLCLVIGADDQSLPDSKVELRSFESAVAGLPTTPVDDEALGTSMLYSSGTTGRPKGILRPLPELPPVECLPLYSFLLDLWQYREDMVYLSPAPLYHSAPQAAVGLTLRKGGTVVIMERFDPEEYLQNIARFKITHSQLVPTMFSRMLKLPEEVRAAADLSTLEIAIHAAAPCEWLANRGSVGKVIMGELHVLDEDGKPCAEGEAGELWFKRATEFSYFNNAAKTEESSSADGTMSTVGDVGYVKDGYLYLTDRSTFMIISGGVNIYPQETEDLLITHPKIEDAAVFGVPNEDLGEEVKAVVQVLDGVEANDALVQELMAYCQDHLSRQKCPRSIDFEAELPRLPTGKLYKRLLKDKYWAEHSSGIL